MRNSGVVGIRAMGLANQTAMLAFGKGLRQSRGGIAHPLDPDGEEILHRFAAAVEGNDSEIGLEKRSERCRRSPIAQGAAD